MRCIIPSGLAPYLPSPCNWQPKIQVDDNDEDDDNDGDDEDDDDGDDDEEDEDGG